MPRLGLGTYRMTDPGECRRAVETALETGYRHVDTAQLYDNERYVGEAVDAAAVPREEVLVATKLWRDRLGYEDAVASARRSRDRLGVDTIDLLYVHWPMGDYDPEGTLAALDDLRAAGVVDRVGLSNFTPALLDAARERLEAPVFAHQVEMHPLLPQAELRAYAREHGHWLVAYAPVARNRVADVPEIREVAGRHGATPAQVSLAWLLDKERVAPIPKAATPAHVRENYGALDVALDRDDRRLIDGIDRRERLIDPPDAPWNRNR